MAATTGNCRLTATGHQIDVSSVQVLFNINDWHNVGPDRRRRQINANRQAKRHHVELPDRHLERSIRFCHVVDFRRTH
jgi:hypothetical protein